MQPSIDTTKPHSARVYDYYLGGKNHFAVDRATAEATIQRVPTVRTGARENRAFLARAVRYLVTEAGIRQFLDIGTGLPSTNNVHEVAQSVAPECRVVYVDNDPIVLAHARALLTSAPQGRTAYIHADLREPDAILADPAVGGTLDFSQPIALILCAVLHFLTDEDDPGAVVARLVGALPPGSYLAASHATPEYSDPNFVAAAEESYRKGGVPFRMRTADELAELVFAGLRMVEPGLVPVADWRPAGLGPRPLPDEVGINGGVARKP